MQAIINLLQSIPSQILCIIELLSLLCFIFLALYKFQSTGLIVYSAITIILANIQILKTVVIADMQIAAGTIAFATTYIATEILIEHYGESEAKKNVYLGFMAQIMFTIVMIITVSYKTSSSSIVVNNAMIEIFAPAPRFAISSLLAYFASQITDIVCFSKLKKITNNKLLWLRTNIANISATITDTLIFNLLAWIILNPTPLTLNQVFFIYMLPGFVARILIGFLTTPVLYLSYKLVS